MTEENTVVEAPDPEPAPDSQFRLIQAMTELKTAGDTGANWFYWIAGLSLVNTLIAHLGGDVHFVVGLAITFIVDVIAAEIGKQNPEAMVIVTAIAVGFSLFVSAFAALFGWMARQRWQWAFGLGMAIYLLDGLLYLAFLQFMSVAFHAYSLYSMIQGFNAYRKLNQIEGALTSIEPKGTVSPESDHNEAMEMA